MQKGHPSTVGILGLKCGFSHQCRSAISLDAKIIIRARLFRPESAVVVFFWQHFLKLIYFKTHVIWQWLSNIFLIIAKLRKMIKNTKKVERRV